MAMQIRNRGGVIYTAAGRIDISARLCVHYMRVLRAHGPGRIASAYRREMIFRLKLTEWKASIPSAMLFGKIRSYFKVSSRYLRLQQSNIVNDKDPPAIPAILLFTTFISFFLPSFDVFSEREKKE